MLSLKFKQKNKRYNQNGYTFFLFLFYHRLTIDNIIPTINKASQNKFHSLNIIPTAINDNIIKHPMTRVINCHLFFFDITIFCTFIFFETNKFFTAINAKTANKIKNTQVNNDPDCPSDAKIIVGDIKQNVDATENLNK